MARPETRGGWTIHQAISARWDAGSLDDVFKSFWNDPTDTDFEVLYEGEAADGAPHPYAVYSVDEPEKLHGSGGVESDQIVEVLSYRVTFELHAAQIAARNMTAKAVAIELAKRVARSFDPDEPLDVSPYKWIQTRRGPDGDLPEGDKECAWVLIYDIEIEATYESPRA
jgi:hypothetical protein